MTGYDAWLSLLWVLLCVVLIVGLAYWFTRFVAGRNGLDGLGQARCGAKIQVLARSPLGRDQALLLVRVEARYFLLGVTPGGISSLAEFSPEDAATWTAAPTSPGSGPTMSFKQALQAVIKQKRQG